MSGTDIAYAATAPSVENILCLRALSLPLSPPPRRRYHRGIGLRDARYSHSAWVSAHAMSSTDLGCAGSGTPPGTPVP
eukprot:3267415-Rhodomonas_salina.1